MKNALHFPLPQSVDYDGKTYKLNPFFDVVLKVFALQKEDDLLAIDKVNLSLALLVKVNITLPYKKRMGLLDAIFDVLIDTQRGDYSQPQAFDFVQDAGYIYSSFYMDYGIDLYEQQGKLHWCKFVQLFVGLSDKCKIKQIMQIRSKPLPAPTKHNGKERADLMQAKQYYALKYSDAEREANFAKGLRRLAKTMQGMANKDGG